MNTNICNKKKRDELKMEEKELKRQLEEVAYEINSLSVDAFEREDLDSFRKQKNKILIHLIGTTALIEEIMSESKNIKEE